MKLVLAVVILVAVAAAGWLILHACDPTEFADGARVDLADITGQTRLASLPFWPAPIQRRAASI